MNDKNETSSKVGNESKPERVNMQTIEENNKEAEHSILQGESTRERKSYSENSDMNSMEDDENKIFDDGIDTNDAIPRLIGFSVIAVVFGFLLIWSYFAPLDSAAYAPGYVAVESYTKTVQHLEGGIVKEIKVKEGQLVENGDLLLVLDDTQLKAQLEIVEAQYIAALALSSRLHAEQESLEEIKFDKFLLDNLDNSDIQDVIRLQQRVFSSRKVSREGEIDVLNQRIEQLKEQVKGLEEQQKSVKKQIRLYSEEIVEFKALLKKGFTDKIRMREMERKVAELEGVVAQNSSEIVASRIRIGETKLQIIQIENQHQQEVAELLSDTLNTVNDLQERRLAIRDKVSRTQIVAHYSGTVLGMTVHTIGGVVTAGKPILDIVPQGESLIIEAQVSPVDIDKVHTGLVSEVRFSSFKNATTPILEGTVVTVSADRIIDQATGLPYYLARIRITPESYKKLGELELLPGMPADTIIKTGERTVFEYLVQPATNAFARSFIED